MQIGRLYCQHVSWRGSGKCPSKKRALARLMESGVSERKVGMEEVQDMQFVQSNKEDGSIK